MELRIGAGSAMTIAGRRSYVKRRIGQFRDIPDTFIMEKTCVHVLALMAAIVLVPGSASADESRVVPVTKLQRCGDQTCLLISGRRSDPAATVLVEQHEVAVSGGRRWHVSLPLQTVRNWSSPSARTISVEIVGRESGPTQAPMQARLPIGVLGGNTNMAFLDISAP